MKAEIKHVQADIAHLPEMLAWVRLQLAPTSMQKGDRLHVELAMEEALVNVINHADAKKPFEMTIQSQHTPGREITFELSDPASPYNPLEYLPPSNEGRPIEEIEEGGAGLILIRRCMDALFYRREGDKNILTLVKHLP